MTIEIPGLHHVTAITGDARGNVAFYTSVLGERLVKKTVNQDDVSAYHLFYGDEKGSPGHDLTFFDWPHAAPARPGAATIAPIGLRVNGSKALEWWLRRFDEHGVRHGEIADGEGRTVLPFQDPEGQLLELVDDGGRADGRPWAQSPLPAEFALRGFHDVTINSASQDGTHELLTEVLGFRQSAVYDQAEGHGALTVYETGEGGPGAQLRVMAPPGIGRAGIGGVHHVAFRTKDEEQQLHWRGRISEAGHNVTPVIDRFYFKSIYFREPGGTLFEIATDGPGFTADESESELGKRLALPPFLEPQRAAIEAGLRPI